MSKEEEKLPPFKVYAHKFIQAVTSKHIVRLTDKSEDASESKPVISLSFATNGADKYTSMTLSTDEAVELADAIRKVLAEYNKEKK